MMQGIPQKDKDDPVVLSVGAQVSAKYKGAFCEAKVHTVVKNIKVKVAFRKGGTATVTDDQIIGEIRVGNSVEIKDSDKSTTEATITKIQDCSQYTVVFDDGDIATLRRTALCRQSGKHFNACDTLDQLPLTHPEHRGSTKRTKTQDEYESDDEEYAIGKVVCVENTDTKKKNAKESYFPALVVAPKAQENVKIHIKTEYLVRSFKDGRYYTVPKKEVTEFTTETAQKSDHSAVSAAREFLDKNVLPTHWDREVLIDSASLSEQELSDSSDDEPNEVKDRFFAQLLEFMEKRNSPLNKGPSITNRDVDLYRLYYSVEKLGGYANVTKIRNWKAIAKRLGFTPTDAIVKLVKHSYRKFLLAFEEAVSKGIEELPPRINREKARSSSTRSVASPKVPENVKPPKKVEKPTTSSSAADDSENTSESTKITVNPRKLSTASTKSKAASEKATVEIKEKEVKEKEKEKEKEKDKEKEKEKEKEEEKEKVVKKDNNKDNKSSVSTSSKDDEISPTATPSAKKEKPKKKPPENKKSKKEDISDNSKKEAAISAAAKTQSVPSGPSIADDIPIEIDDRLKVYYRGSSDYEAKVLDITNQDGKCMYKVHYKGWNARYDEWIQRESIAENLTKDEAKKKQSGGTAAGNNNNNTNSSGNTSKNSSTSSTNLQTPTTSKNATKRARNRADTTASSRSTTPLSNTSSKTKVAQKRPIRATPTSKISTKGSILDDNSSESDEPIKKPVDKKDASKGDDKISTLHKSSDSPILDTTKDAKSTIKDSSKASIEKPQPIPDTSKSDDEKSTKSSTKSGKSPFVKGKLKTIQRDSSRSSFHSTDSDSSHSVPSDVPNSSKSAYTSENESNEPEKITVAPTASAVASKIDPKKPFRFDEDANDAKNTQQLATFFEKVASSEKAAELKETASSMFPTKKPNIFQEKKMGTQRALQTPASDVKIGGRFSQLEKSLTKDIASRAKQKDVKVEDKNSAVSDIYEFKDTEEFSDTKVSVVPAANVKKESPSEAPVNKKQQLAAQRKQARQQQQQSLQQQKESQNDMEDIESMIKTSIVSFPQNKKAKKSSPVKEEKVVVQQQQPGSMIVARTPVQNVQTSVIPSPNVIVQSNWGIQSSPQETAFSKVITATQQQNRPIPTAATAPVKSESTFDVLRKSPSFNLHESPPKLSTYPTMPTSQISANQSVITTAPANSKASTSIMTGPIKFSSEVDSRDLLKPIMVPSKEDEKPEIEVFKKILDTSFEILPKAEKSTSIADKLLKAINQKEASVSSEKESQQQQQQQNEAVQVAAAVPVVVVKKEENSQIKIEDRKSDLYLQTGKSANSSGKQPFSVISTAAKKPLLISGTSDSKLDEKTPIVKGNNNIELQGIIEKLESAISSPITIESSATSAQQVIMKKQNDDSDTDSDRLVIEDEALESTDSKKKPQMGVLESIMMQDEIHYKINTQQSSTKESDKKIDAGEQQQSETMSLLLCEETIPGSPAPKDPLSEIGRSPTSSSSGGFVHPSMPQSGYNIKYTASMTTALLHQQYQTSTHQSKQMQMDIDNIEAATGDILRDKLKSERGSATSSGNNTNNNSDNSNDDLSEAEKNSKPDITPRKKKRSLKTEPELQQKRRRQQTRTQTNVRGNLQGNDSDSNDNSDVNPFTSRSQVVDSSSFKSQFNFLVELDPNMPTAQRINILEKKIQDLRKTYLLVKNEMNAKERRRKKMRKRERENKQKASKAS